MLNNIIFVSICIIFSTLPLIRNIFGILVTLAAVLTNVASLLSIFYYYHKLPCEKQTILVFLAQCFTIIFGVHIVHSYIVQTLSILLDEDTLSRYCLLLPTGLTWIATVLCLIEMLIFKIILMKSTARYLHMNTKPVKVVCVAIIFISIAVRPIIRFIVTDVDVVCNTIMIINLKKFSSKSRSSPNLPNIFGYVSFLLASLLISEMILAFFDWLFKISRRRRRVVPMIGFRGRVTRNSGTLLIHLYF